MDEKKAGAVEAVFSEGQVFEKAGVNVSVVWDPSPEAAAKMGGGHDRAGEDLDFLCNGLEFGASPHNPMAPTVRR